MYEYNCNGTPWLSHFNGKRWHHEVEAILLEFLGAIINVCYCHRVVLVAACEIEMFSCSCPVIESHEPTILHLWAVASSCMMVLSISSSMLYV